MLHSILSVRDLSLNLKSQRVLQNVNFDIEKGKTLGIVGESGSGKSVSAMAVLGLLPAQSLQITSGKILFCPDNDDSAQQTAVDLLCINPDALRRIRGAQISMIFQDPGTSLNPLHRVGNQVAEALKLHTHLDQQTIYKRVLELFDEVQLPRKEALYQCYPHEISGGQKQRVMIAMALACSPQLLIADEPTTALDVTVQKGVIDLLNQLKVSRQLSILFISHDLAVVSQIADHIGVMYQGTIIENGSVEQVFKYPQTQYTRNLIASRPPVHKIINRLPIFDENGNAQKEEIINPQDTQKRLTHLAEQPTQLEVKNLNCSFSIQKNFWGKTINAVHAVQNVSFKIHKGETLGLVGESGSGKTTIGRCVMRLIDKHNGHLSGDIFILGHNISLLSQKELRPIRKSFQMVFQDPFASLNPRQRIKDTFLEAMRAHNIQQNDTLRLQKTLEWLEKVGLPQDSISRFPHEFSGGQRQRICIARALCIEPEILVCDESVSALDVSTQAQILNLLKDLRDQLQLTILFITHDLSVVRFICDRVIALKNGQIVENTDVLSLYQHAQHPYTQELLASAPIFPYESPVIPL